MSFFQSFMPAWVEGLFSIISHIGKVVMVILQNSWHMIVIVVSCLVVLSEKIAEFWDAFITQAEAAWDVLYNSAEAMNSAMAAGWHPQFANAVAYCNEWFPLSEMVAGMSALLFLFFVCAFIRVIKSLIPVFNT